jgi:ABC-type bacteriocin/lantibiotic exporter with double-glycine peptidase domain
VNFIYVACLLWLTSPLLLASAYLTFILLGNEMSPEVAFTTMTIVSLFQSPISSLPNAVSEWIQILTSLKRIEKFLFVQEIKNDHISFVDDSETAVRIREGNFYWKKEEQIKQP